MTIARRTHPLYLVALLALAGAACSDDDRSPTGPAAAEPATIEPAAAPKPPRTPYISDVQLHFPVIDMGPDGTYDNGVDIVLTNPSKTAQGLYIEATVSDNHYTVSGGSNWIYCAAAEGTLPRGTCRVMFFVTPPPSHLQLGPARLTIRLMQRGADNSLTALDHRTLDVVLVHS